MRYLVFIFTQLFFLSIFGQKGTIKGHVYDNIMNEPMIFATVKLENTNYGTITDIDGNFTLSVPPGQYQLHLRYIGYRDSIIPAVTVLPNDTTHLKINYPPPCKYSDKKHACPVCKKRNKVIPILYGYPSKGLLRDAENGKVILGGCVISECDPKWYCKRDSTRF